MKTQCCNYEAPEGIPYPVMWNQFNKVVQCHNCGEIYVPADLARTAYRKGTEDTMKWVSKFCEEQTERLLYEAVTNQQPR